MGMVSREQALEAGAKIQTNVDWGQLDSAALQEVLRDPVALGRKCTIFLANGAEMQIVMTTDGIQVPEGGRIHTVAVPANESRDWKDAVGAAGPNTGRDWTIWRMGDQYPPSESGSGLVKVVLVHFGKGRNTRSEDNIEWGKSQHLVPASPRKVFAVGEHCQNLHRDLGMDPMAVVSLKKCSFEGVQHCARVWFRGSRRLADGDWFGGGWDDDCWFAFVRESEASLLAE